MKKTKKQELFENILNYEELSILKGGILSREVRNINCTTQCNCDYNNSSAHTNMNFTMTCSCTCI